MATATGLLHGTTITLDSPVPPLEGKRVHVVIEAVDEPVLTAESQRTMWGEWVRHGGQGPLEEDEDDLA